MAESLIEGVNRQIARDSRMTPMGLKQLIDAKPITNAADRKALIGYLYWLHGRFAGCEPPRPPSPNSRHH
jgi:hypothetical protein